MAESRINMRGKDGIISDSQVSLGVIDEGDNNDTYVEKKKTLIFLTRANGSYIKFIKGSSIFAGNAKYSS